MREIIACLNAIGNSLVKMGMCWYRREKRNVCITVSLRRQERWDPVFQNRGLP